jgi:hypothetical protein
MKELHLPITSFVFAMPIPTHNFSYEEFQVFVMLYAANADGRITSKEEDLISPGLNPDAYDMVKRAFYQCDDNEALSIILSYQSRYLNSKSDRDRVLADMTRIYEADAGFQQIERGVHKLFSRILNSL